MRSIFGMRGLIAAAALMVSAIVLGSVTPASAQAKVALLIGNGAYQNAPELPNPPNDAADVAAGLLRLGFSVRLVTDATYDTMRLALIEFNRKTRDAEMAVVFFAGHGMEVGGENWLVPIDAQLKSDSDTEQETISLRSIMQMVSSASKLGLVVLDACRNNPFLAKMKRTTATRAVSRGLAPIEPMTNILVAYSAKDGTTAADGEGRNSPFTTALLKHLETPGLEINFLFRNVRDDVIADTRSEQQPFIYGSLTKEPIYLKPSPAAPVIGGPDQFARIAALAAAQAAWLLLKETTDKAALQRFIAQYPDNPLRKEAEARIAALEARPEKGPTDTHELTRLLQIELKRIGCFSGAVNGEFDDATRIAAQAFAKLRRHKCPRSYRSISSERSEASTSEFAPLSVQRDNAPMMIAALR